MAAAIANVWPALEVKLVAGGRGDFVVRAGEKELWNKRSVGRFPDPGEILEELRAIVAE